MKSLHVTGQDLVWTLLKKKLSKGQLLGYTLANVIGFAIIMTGIMFYADSRHSDDGEDDFLSKDYVVISKRVSGIGFTPITFDEEEIQTLQQQPWVKKIGRFTSSQFNIRGSLELGTKCLSTYLFVESVPDEFFDVKPKGWNFTPQNRTIPIIISKDYLTLYNFGFAIPQGLPQISEEFVSSVPLNVQLMGKDNLTDHFEASIVGFSSRLNTIAVPQSFMDWANRRYAADAPDGKPSRLIVEIDRLNAEAMNTYLSESGIEIAGDKAETGNISKFLSLSSAIVTINGLLICALATFILTLSIFLLLQKSQTTINHLVLLGYSPREVGRYYERIILTLNVMITLVAIVLSLAARSVWLTYMEEIGIGGASVLCIYVTALVYFVLTTLINIIVIRRQLKKIWITA